MLEYGMVRVMTAVPRVWVADPAENAKEICALMDRAEEQKASLCVFPELTLSGYTCADLFLQPALLSGCLDGLNTVLSYSLNTDCVFAVGLPLEIGHRLYNVAVMLHKGRILGVVPKEHLPNYREFYERRWFDSGSSAPEETVLLGQTVPVDEKLVFDCGDWSFGAELCEDMWVPEPPSAKLAMAGALMIVNLSAGNEIVTKHAYRKSLISQQSARTISAYLYAGAGCGESTTDLVFSGYAGIYENGRLMAENERFRRESSFAVADIDVERLRFRRRENRSFFDDEPAGYRIVRFDAPDREPKENFLRFIAKLPFVPAGAELNERTREILLIQTTGLLSRMEHIGTRKAVLGVSGGLDSTLTLLAAAYAYERAGWDKKDIIGITMPGFGTGGRTRSNAEKLMELIGCTTLTIPIGPAVRQHFNDIGQDSEKHDIAYENSQARERTQIIMDYANKIGGIALGTGDLSELALGWCTYNGDQMSMYNMSGSVPKTLIKHLVRWVGGQLGGDIIPVIQDILDTPISPELIPSKEGEIDQRTEDTLGAYALHDFFLYHLMDSGASPKKLFALCMQAMGEDYGRDAILKALRTFVWRFFTQQFKRSAMPDGPKVGSVSLSPRGDWRMPSDAKMTLWLNEVKRLQGETI